MAAYVAMARITNASPRRAVHRAAIQRAEAELVEIEHPAVEDLTGRPFLAAISDTWDDLREIWRQAMDVLRDPRIY